MTKRTKKEPQTTLTVDDLAVPRMKDRLNSALTAVALVQHAVKQDQETDDIELDATTAQAVVSQFD